MPSRVARIQPFRATDGDADPLVAFAVASTPLVEASFLPGDRLSEWVTEPAGEDAVRRTRQHGGHLQGFRITHEQGFAQDHSIQSVDRVTVEAYGLRDASLTIECTRAWYAPRFVELRITGVDAASLAAVLQRFGDDFDHGNAPTTSEIPIVVGNARAAVSAGDWGSAEMFANAILQTDPRQADALMYLGVARGAQGDLATAEEALLLAIEADPEQYDAWYNLGALYMNRCDPRRAIMAFQESLHIRPESHAVLFQLGHAYEAAGQATPAREAYEAAVRNAPNPHGYWGYRGLDYTEQAREALRRLST